MMQLLCNGVRLDLYDNAGLQFTHNNPLFAFDKLECERTTQFKLPCTPTNDAVFALARVPAYAGAGMRRKFAAELQAGTVVKKGYLYISKFDGTDYEAIFVTGEFIGLQTVKNLGKIADIMQYSESVIAYQNIYNANNAALDALLLAHMRYNGQTGTNIKPSINIGLLIDKICTHLNIACNTPAQAYKMRLAPYELVLPASEVGHMHSTNTGVSPINTIYPDELQRLTIVENDMTGTYTRTYHNGHNNPLGEVIQVDTTSQVSAHFKSLNNIVLTFPDDMPSNYVLIFINDAMPMGCTFYGNYSFTKVQPAVGQPAVAVFSGTPLAGRSVEIPANYSFLLARADDYVVTTQNTYIYIDDEPVPVTETARGWDFSNGLTYNFSVQIEPQESEAQNGDTIRLQDNLPEITFTELLKGLATELGLVLNYSDANGITFEDVNYATYPIKAVATLEKRSEVKRCFSDYQQNNIVSYTKDDAFTESEQTPVVYTIDNKNLQVQKDLLVLHWTNGGAYATSSGVIAFDKVGRKTFLELRAGADIDAMRATIIKNNNIQGLCDASTQFKITARMTMMEYNAIGAKVVLNIDGSLYLWTERSWQDDTATFTLAKVL